MDARRLFEARNGKKKVTDANAASARIGGHWGEDAVGFRWTEKDSSDNRFQQMDCGQFFSGTIYTPADGTRPLSHTAKGLCIRLGDKNEAAVCFDTELLRISAAWTGPFLQIDPARYGIIQPPKIAGEVQFTAPSLPGWAQARSLLDTRPSKPFGPLPREHARYNGLYLHGKRVLISSSVGKSNVIESPWFETVDGVPIFTRTLELSASDEKMEFVVCGPDGVGVVAGSPPGVSLQRLPDGVTTVRVAPRSTPLQLVAAIAAKEQVDVERLQDLAARLAPAPSLQSLARPGPVRWTAEITTRGEIGKPNGNSFAIDTLTLPFENPYRALFFVSGHDFVAKDVAAICTLHGDVWLVSGIDERLDKLHWRRFATGLFQPLGLKIVHDQIYVVGRDQITRLHDRDRNGEADWYENFNNEGHVTTNGHEYVTCLETDSRGNFYFLKGDSGGKTDHDGCLLQVTPDGSRLSVFATGFRNANGMAIGPNDEITVAPQEGEWTPASGIFSVQPGGFHGAMSVHHRMPPPTDYVKPICWLSRRMDNSSGGQVWIPPSQWGPLGGKMLHLSYGQCSMMVVLRDDAAPNQGSVVPLPLTFQSGVMRGRFHPQDGHLYVSGLHGWVSNAVADGCLQRVRYVAQELVLPVQVTTRSNGLLVTFSEPLQPESAEDPDNYQIEQWNNRWSAQYGSPELKPSQPNVEGRDRILIESATLMENQRTVFLEISNLQPVSVLQLNCQMTTAQGKTAKRQLACTIHQVSTTEMPALQLTGRRPSKYLTDEQRKSLVPGLRFEFSQKRGTQIFSDVTRRRLAALDVSATEPASTFLQPGPFEVVVQGFLRLNEPGKAKLRIEGTGSARAYLKGELIAELGPRVSVEKIRTLSSVQHDLRGYVPIRLEYTSSQAGAEKTRAQFRLLWEREDGIEEVIPPTVFFCLGNESSAKPFEHSRRVMQTVMEFRCVRCHPIDSPTGASAVEKNTLDGPSLKSAGERLNPKWIAAWVLAPGDLRNNAKMPAFLRNPSQVPHPASRQKAAHLAAYISSLRETRAADLESASEQPTANDVEAGRRLWEQLGCIGCHRTTPVKSPDEFDRISLQYVSVKFTERGLKQFLQQPHAHYSATQMPDFHLNSDEVRALSAFLTMRSVPIPLDAETFPEGNITEGRRLAEQLRCGSCHDFGRENLPRSGGPTAKEKSFQALTRVAGCLDPTPKMESLAPRFQLTANQREDFEHAIGKSMSEAAMNWKSCTAEEAQRRFESLRCSVCHGRDQESSRLPTILAEDGELGWLPEPFPSLTYTGERLYTSWMQRFVAGVISERPRPHLITRMPAFPGYADVLARGFAAQHGIRDEEPTRRKSLGTHDDLALGYRLTLKDGGLDCRQCHAVGNQSAQGDDKTRLAPGINFVHLPERLRYDFYRRFVLDPPRYEINTRMPKLAPDGRTTSVMQIYQGDARRQFDAIWDYLQTIHGVEP